jgi:hypothetical protein
MGFWGALFSDKPKSFQSVGLDVGNGQGILKFSWNMVIKLPQELNDLITTITVRHQNLRL